MIKLNFENQFTDWHEYEIDPCEVSVVSEVVHQIDLWNFFHLDHQRLDRQFDLFLSKLDQATIEY